MSSDATAARYTTTEGTGGWAAFEAPPDRPCAVGRSKGNLNRGVSVNRENTFLGSPVTNAPGLIRIAVLTIFVALALPASAAVQVLTPFWGIAPVSAESSVAHPTTHQRARPGTAPCKTCPFLELRAALALCCLKSGARPRTTGGKSIVALTGNSLRAIPHVDGRRNEHHSPLQPTTFLALRI